MLFGTHRQTSAPTGGLQPLWSILAAAGLQSNASFCLDAGDAASYAGTGQTWLDRSAGGFDFWLGPTNGTESADPAFTGAAGDLTLNSYFSFDGGDWFDYDSGAEAFMRSWHAAGAAFTLMALIYVPPGVTWGVGGKAIFSTLGASGSGIAWGFNANDGRPRFNNTAAVNSTVHDLCADATVGAGWHLMALVVAAGVAGGSFFYRDGAYDPVASSNTLTLGYSGAGSSASVGQKLRIGYGDPSGFVFLPNGIRMMGAAAIARVATKVELDAVWALARQRLGI
jgi:hypothetical protein